MRVRTDGKFFARGTDRFLFRAVSVSETEAQTPDEFRRRLGTAVDQGFTVVQTPLAAPELLVEPTLGSGMHVLLRAELPWQDLHSASRADRRRTLTHWASVLHRQMQPWDDAEQLLGLVLASGRAGFDSEGLRQSIDRLAGAVHEQTPDLLLTAALPAPVGIPAPHGLDFLTFDPAGTDPATLSHALDSAHCAVGDAPLVLGPLTPSSLEELDRLALTGLDRGVGGWWASAVPTAPVNSVRSVAGRTVYDLPRTWPAVSVVVCAYNAEETLDECLSACDELDYPALEVLVVDDGSTDATPAIADAHSRATRVTVPHGGLSAARNAGYRAAGGHLVAYLDSDAYPPPEWVHYLALALGDSPAVAGCGGPNVPPRDDPLAAQVVARSPGGPIPQLRSERRAVHVPGCNMAFTRKALHELGGFDEALWTASDDLEFGWRFTDAGYEIGYHPAALVWHHRRPGLQRYLKQQRGYGRSQAIVEARYPDRFPSGHRLRKLGAMLRRGEQAEAPAPMVTYRSLYWRERSLVTIAHQWGLPAAVLLTATAPLGLLRRSAALPALAGVGYVAGLFAVDLYLSGSDNPLPEPTLACRASIATHRLLRPLAFRWGHLSQTWQLRRG